MIGPTDLLHPYPAPHFKTFQVFLICYDRKKRRNFFAVSEYWLSVEYLRWRVTYHIAKIIKVTHILSIWLFCLTFRLGVNEKSWVLSSRFWGTYLLSSIHVFFDSPRVLHLLNEREITLCKFLPLPYGYRESLYGGQNACLLIDK